MATDDRPYDFTTGPGYGYVKLADHLAAEIVGGALPAGARLLSERAMAQHYGVSTVTARHATELLRERGLVETWHGKGTYVKNPATDEPA